MKPTDKIDICLDQVSRRFRWKSEVKSNNNNGNKISSHGNYLSGRIQLPRNLLGSRYKFELCLVPSLNSDQNIFKAHPYLLHLTHPETFFPLTDISKDGWKLTFDLDVQNGVISKYHNGSTLRLPFEKNSSVITLGK